MGIRGLRLGMGMRCLWRRSSSKGNLAVDCCISGYLEVPTFRKPHNEEGLRNLPVPFVLHTDCPHYWRYHLPCEIEEDFATRLTKNLEDLILKEGPEMIAALIAEPVMGAGGVIPPPPTYFDKVVCAFGPLVGSGKCLGVINTTSNPISSL